MVSFVPMTRGHTHESVSPRGLFIAGTETGVGKTRVTCWLARLLRRQGIRLGLCKPAVTGAERRGARWVWPDIELLRAACDAPVTAEQIGPYRWRLPLAPPVAARLEGSESAMPTLADYLAALNAWQNRCDILVAEGIGGLMCPLTETETVADLASAWDRPVLIVARLGLGTLNHTLLTVEAALARRLRVLAVLLNSVGAETWGLAERTNPDELRRRLAPLPVWGPIGYQITEEPIPAPITNVPWVELLS